MKKALKIVGGVTLLVLFGITLYLLGVAEVGPTYGFGLP